jgi:hypothetical protein
MDGQRPRANRLLSIHELSDDHDDSSSSSSDDDDDESSEDDVPRSGSQGHWPGPRRSRNAKKPLNKRSDTGESKKPPATKYVAPVTQAVSKVSKVAPDSSGLVAAEEHMTQFKMAAEESERKREACTAEDARRDANIKALENLMKKGMPSADSPSSAGTTSASFVNMDQLNTLFDRQSSHTRSECVSECSTINRFLIGFGQGGRRPELKSSEKSVWTDL